MCPAIELGGMFAALVRLPFSFHALEVVLPPFSTPLTLVLLLLVHFPGMRHNLGEFFCHSVIGKALITAKAVITKALARQRQREPVLAQLS